MTEVVWTDVALLPIHQTHTFIAKINPDAAARVVRDLRDDGDSLSEQPRRGRPVPGTRVRELAVVPPYLMRYRIAGTSVMIRPVRQTSRRATKP